MIALDASALLAFLFDEEGGDRVAAMIESSCLSTVNLCEVLARFARDGHDPYLVARRIAATPIELVRFEVPDAALAAQLFAPTSALGLSLGDRACLALALARGIPAMTADRGWRELEIGVPIELIR
jgi:PIN domain nuclease of toxin-antitoxin system